MILRTKDGTPVHVSVDPTSSRRDKIVLRIRPGSIEVASPGTTLWAEFDDEDLFIEDWREPLMEEFQDAADALIEMQNYSGHARCPNTRNPPTGCQVCLDNFGDANAVWKCLMKINKNWTKP